MKIKLLIFLILDILVIPVFFIIRIETNKPPQGEMMHAKQMLSKAQLENSQRYAADIYKKAEIYYDSAMVEWRYQNERFILIRNYEKIIELAEKSSATSEKAINNAQKNISNTADLLELRLEMLDNILKSFDQNYGSFPISKDHRQTIVNCKLLYSEAIHAHKNKNYSICSTKIDYVEKTIVTLFNYYQEKLITYFEEYPSWKKKVRETIIYSKKSKSHVIIIDKLARELSIYKNGKIFKSFSIELGYNWVGNKQQQGDKTTPEGLYKIINKMQNGQTKYYKALLIDYPNKDDEKRFVLNKKNGLLSRNAKIGNLIEIHGNGGKGIDWTDGCIALKDTDMDMVFRICPIGTKVTIVGSTKSLNELSIILL